MQTKESVIIEAGIEGVSTRVDNTIKITLGTQELGADSLARIFRLRGKAGLVLISTGEVSQDQIDLVEKSSVDFELGNKTKSQRLRGVLYRLWESLGARDDFDAFYNAKMNKLIEHFKQQIDES
jgi:Ribonuclease G/E